MRVRWRYRDSAGRIDEAEGSLLSVEGSDATVRFSDSESGEVLTIPFEHLTLPSGVDRAKLSDVDALSSRGIRAPSEDDLALINRFLPEGVESFSADDLVVVSFIAADNLVNRSYDAWDAASLKRMAELFPGLPATEDHSWEDHSKVWGTVFRSFTHQMPQPPPGVSNRAGLKTRNDLIVQTDGYICVVADVFARVTEPVVGKLSAGAPGFVSTGGFRFRDYHCPICGTSFSDPDCPHTPDAPWRRSGDSAPNVAPYSVRFGLFDLGEISTVLIPNLPGAGLIRHIPHD